MTSSASARTSGSDPCSRTTRASCADALVMRDHTAHEILVRIARKLDGHIGVHLVVNFLIGPNHRVVRRRAGAVSGMLTVIHGRSLSLLVHLGLRVGEPPAMTNAPAMKIGVSLFMT